MFSLQQLIKATATASPAGSGVGGAVDLYKFLRQFSSSSNNSSVVVSARGVTSSSVVVAAAEATNTAIQNLSSQESSSELNFSENVSHNSPSLAHGCCSSESKSESAHFVNLSKQFVHNILQQRSQDIQRQLHTQRNGNNAKSSHPQQQHQQQQQTTTKFAMSSLAAEPLQAEISTSDGSSLTAATAAPGEGAACHDAASSAGKKPCFNTGLADILQFMELIGNLKVSAKQSKSENEAETGWQCKQFLLCLHAYASIFQLQKLIMLF